MIPRKILTNKFWHHKVYIMKKFFANIKPLWLKITSKKEEILGKYLIRNAYTISTTESCTGGLLSSRLTDVSGSSNYVKANFVTYSYDAKKIILGVNQETLDKFGAVSEQCAYEMAKGLSEKTHADIAVATTGIAGPNTDGGKPVGLMYSAICYKGKIQVKKFEYSPLISRKNMKFMFTEGVLDFILETITN